MHLHFLLKRLKKPHLDLSEVPLQAPAPPQGYVLMASGPPRARQPCRCGHLPQPDGTLGGSVNTQPHPAWPAIHTHTRASTSALICITQTDTACQGSDTHTHTHTHTHTLPLTSRIFSRQVNKVTSISLNCEDQFRSVSIIVQSERKQNDSDKG